MSITTVLFDLDGTLLPMDQDLFVKTYFSGIAKKVAPLGYEPEKLIKTIWAGTAAMVKNTGEINNEEAFWLAFAAAYGEDSLKDIPAFDEFYLNEFEDIKNVCGYTPKAAEVIRLCKEKGLRTVLATNPIFPSVATVARTRWAGLSVDDFELYTTYENSYHCKPNPDYYRDILNTLGLEPSECLMVGNDAHEDTVAETLGMKVFLLTDCLINKNNIDISKYPNGDFDALIDYIGKL